VTTATALTLPAGGYIVAEGNPEGVTGFVVNSLIVDAVLVGLFFLRKLLEEIDDNNTLTEIGYFTGFILLVFDVMILLVAAGDMWSRAPAVWGNVGVIKLLLGV
jgi:hypothetical protein